MNINKNIRFLIVTMIMGVIVATPFIVVSEFFFPFITGKSFFFRIIVEVITALWLILAISDREYRPRKSYIFYSVLALLGVSFVSSLMGESFYKSFWSSFERMDGFVTSIHLLMYFSVLVSVLNTEKIWNRFWQFSLGASAIMGLIGIGQLIGVADIHQSGVRIDARFGNSAYFAVYALIHCFISLWFIVKTYKEDLSFNNLWPYIIVFLLNLNALYYTATRGAILGFIAGLLLTVILMAIGSSGLIKKISIGITIAIVFFVLVFLGVKNSEFVKNSPVLSRFANISLNEATTESRFIIWGMSIEGWKERPILGWGAENYNLVFNKFYDPRLYRQEQWFDRAHNVFLDWLVMHGSLGLISYVGLFAVLLYTLWKKIKDWSFEQKAVVTGLVAAYLGHNFFVFDHLVSYVLLFSVLAWVASSNNQNGERFFGAVKDFNERNKNYLFALFAIVLCFTIYFVNIKPMRAAETIIDAIAPRDQKVETNLLEFKKLFSLNTFGTMEGTEQIMLRAPSYLRSSATSFQMQGDIAGLAVKQGEELIARFPQDARYYLIFGSMLRQIGQLDRAVLIYEKALSLSPKKQTIMLELADTLSAKGEIEKSLNVSKTAYELDKRFDDAFYFYVSSLIRAQKQDDADALLIERNGSTFSNDDKILNSYVVIGNFERVVEIWEKRVEERPGDLQSNISLGVAYLEAGNRQGAIAQIEKAIKIDPNFRQQGEMFIREVREGRKPYDSVK